MLEYFINTHGARKGLADTALRHRRLGLPDPSSGRRLPGRHRSRARLRHRAGILVDLAERAADGTLIRDPHVETSAYARTLAADAVDAEGNVVVERGHDLGDPAIDAALEAGITSVKVRSVLTCASAAGVCRVLRPLDGHRQAG